mgnify:CR=1 FL=1
METKTRYTSETIEVRPIDMEKLNADIEKHFHKDGKHPTNIQYRVHGVLGIISHPKLCFIDDEFVGHELSDKITFYIHETETHLNGKITGNCFPGWEINMCWPELEQYLKPSITLAEFTANIRGYNFRIRNNEGEWRRFLNK